MEEAERGRCKPTVLMVVALTPCPDHQNGILPNSEPQLTTCCQTLAPMLLLQETDLISKKADLASGVTWRDCLQFK